MKTTKRKLNWLKFGSIFGLIAPMAVVIGVNFNNYFTIEKGVFLPQALEVGVGAILGIGTATLLALNKTQFLKRSRALIIGLILSILLKSIINDIILIMTALTAGSLINMAFKTPIENLKKTYDYEKQAGIQAKAMSNVMKELAEPEIVRSGRV